SPLLRWYLAAVAAGGACVLLGAALQGAPTLHPLGWVALAAVAVGAGSLNLNIAGDVAAIAIDDTFYIAIAILFGPGPAAVTIATGGLVQSVRRKRPARQVVFNTASHALSMWGAAQVFFLLARVQPLIDGEAGIGSVVLPLFALAAVYFALNSGLT